MAQFISRQRAERHRNSVRVCARVTPATSRAQQETRHANLAGPARVRRAVGRGGGARPQSVWVAPDRPGPGAAAVRQYCGTKVIGGVSRRPTGRPAPRRRSDSFAGWRSRQASLSVRCFALELAVVTNKRKQPRSTGDNLEQVHFGAHQVASECVAERSQAQTATATSGEPLAV